MLARLGWAAALTRDGLERTDILAVDTNRTGDRPTIEIQVKTASDRGPRTSWALGKKSQEWSPSVREWFVFVLLPPDQRERPRSFIVPRLHVSAAAWIAHQSWRTDPTVPDGQRNATLDQARVEVAYWQGYEDRWDLLGEPTTSTPVLLPPASRSLALLPRVGLPEGHPWRGHLPVW